MFPKSRTLQLQSLLKDNPNMEWPSENLSKTLKVHTSWVYNNKSKLEALGFKIERKEHKQHKPHIEHVHKGKSKDVDERNLFETTDLTAAHKLKFKSYFFLRYYINKLHIKYGLVAPFELESEESTKTTVLPYVLDLLDSRLEEENIDIESILIKMEQTEDETDPDHLSNYPFDYTAYLSVLTISLEYLKPLEVSGGMRITIKRAFQHIHGFEPTEEQIQCVAKVTEFVSNPRLRAASIQSDAGSSKSTTALVIQHILSDINPLITAKTNKALSKFIHSKTIAKVFLDIMGTNIMKDSEELQLTKAEKRRGIIDFIIVDEASMVSLHERTLLETLCQKVLYIGDKEQMKPVGGKLAYNFTYLHTLRHQYRFNNAESDFQVTYTKYNKEKRTVSATKLLNSKLEGTFDSTVKYVKQENGNLELKSFYTHSFSKYKDIILQYKENNCQVIAFSQDAVDNLNYIMNDNSNELKIGSKVILIINNYDQAQYNGFQYRIKEIHGKDYVCVAIETEEEYTFEKSWLELAYAITTLKAQGSQWDHVLCIDGTSSTFDRNRDRYVLITRGSVSVKILQKSFSKQTSKVTITDTDEVELIHSKLSSSKEGSRNNTLYVCTKELIEINGTNEDFIKLKEIALSLGLTEEEIDSTINSARQGTSIIKTKKPPPPPTFQ